MISRAVYDLIKTITETNLLVPDNSDKNLELFLKNELHQYKVHGADSLVFRTIKLAWEIFEQCQSAKHTIERLENSLANHGVDWNMLGRELSFDEMRVIGDRFIENAEDMNKKLGTRIPAIPFGHKNSTWEWMLREYQVGDKFYSYGSRHDDEDPNRPTQSGYCMARGNKIMIVLTTMRS